MFHVKHCSWFSLKITICRCTVIFSIQDIVKKIYKKIENVSRETFSILYLFSLSDVVSASEKNVLVYLFGEQQIIE